MPIEEFFEEWDVESLKEGNIIRARNFEEMDKETRLIRVDGMRALIKKLGDLYHSKKPPTKGEFNEIFEKYEKKVIDDSSDILDQLETSEDLFKVEKKTVDKEGNVIIKMKKLDKEERINY